MADPFSAFPVVLLGQYFGMIAGPILLYFAIKDYVRKKSTEAETQRAQTIATINAHTDEKFNVVQAVITSNQEKITSLREDVDEITGKVTNLGEKMVAVEGKIPALETLDKVKEDLIVLKTQLDGAAHKRR